MKFWIKEGTRGLVEARGRPVIDVMPKPSRAGNMFIGQERENHAGLLLRVACHASDLGRWKSTDIGLSGSEFEMDFG